jgi:hypothetical protein
MVALKATYEGLSSAVGVWVMVRRARRWWVVVTQIWEPLLVVAGDEVAGVADGLQEFQGGSTRPPWAG